MENLTGGGLKIGERGGKKAAFQKKEIRRRFFLSLGEKARASDDDREGAAKAFN
jgi:hypothetical protein